MHLRKETIISIPIDEVVKWINQNHSIDGDLSRVNIQKSELMLVFTEGESKLTSSRNRNRMRTRGWTIIGRVKVSNNQIAKIYKPFVDALSKEGLTEKDRYDIVRDILESNGNIPNDSNIEYILETTTDFIEGRNIFGKNNKKE